jgi:hypothetical protein
MMMMIIMVVLQMYETKILLPHLPSSIKNKKKMKTSNQPFKQQKRLDERALAKTVVMDNMDMDLPNEVK